MSCKAMTLFPCHGIQNAHGRGIFDARFKNSQVFAIGRQNQMGKSTRLELAKPFPIRSVPYFNDSFSRRSCDDVFVRRNGTRLKTSVTRGNDAAHQFSRVRVPEINTISVCRQDCFLIGRETQIMNRIAMLQTCRSQTCNRRQAAMDHPGGPF